MKDVGLERRKKSGKCTSAIWHGPGHQSRTFCQKKGKHKVHFCLYGSYQQEASWTGDEVFSGVFDEPPEVDE